MSVEVHLRSLLCDHLGVEPLRVVAASKIVDDIGADSLDLVELLFAAEDEFGIEIENEAWLQASTFGQMVTLVEGLLQ